MKNIERELRKQENKRITNLFKEQSYSKQEIKCYCVGYADALLYNEKEKVISEKKDI